METKRINVETTAYEADQDFPEAAHYPEFVAAALSERYSVPVECSVGLQTRAVLYGAWEDESATEYDVVSAVKVELWDAFCDHGYKTYSAASIKEINGEFDRAALERLTWPIAWSGEPDRAYEAALKALRDDGVAQIDARPGAVAVDVIAGEVVSVILADDEELDVENTVGERRVVTEKFLVVCQTDDEEGEDYTVIGHQLPDRQFLTIATNEGQSDDLWASREDYAPNGMDTIESITSLGASSIRASDVEAAIVRR